MKTFSINTLGCKVNQYESQQVREFLEGLGLNMVQLVQKPDLIIINTCCVTHTASAKSRQTIHKAQRLCPEAAIFVCGCLPTVLTGELKHSAKNVHLVRNRANLFVSLSQAVNNKAYAFDTNSPQTFPNITIKAKNRHKIKNKKELENYPKLPLLSRFNNHTRAFLKIQDGCDGFCTYCIVPKTRPFVHSKPIDEALQEAQALVEAGHKEIVVTGIFIGAYGQKSVRRKNWPEQRNDNLADLLDKMAEIPNLARIRLSSLEPADVTSRLLDSIRKQRNIMPHLHLSLQSGSNIILKKMRRQYKADEFKQKAELIKSMLDRPAITTDIIVGFPGETDTDFEQTIDLAKEICFAKIHVFSFSPRKGTAAADMKDLVDNRVKKKRSQILRNLDIELGMKYRRQFLGETAEILVESNNGQLYGRSERYFKVLIENTKNKLKQNNLISVKLIENSEHGMIGRLYK